MVGALDLHLLQKRTIAPPESLPCRGLALELGLEACQGGQFRVDVIRDVHHERRGRCVLTEQQAVHHLLRTMSLPWSRIAPQACEERRVVCELGGDPVIRVPALAPMGDDDAGSQLADESDDSFPGLPVVRETGVTETRVPSDGQAEHVRRSCSLLLPDLWGPLAAAFPTGEVQDPYPISGSCGLRQGSSAVQLRVVGVSHDSKDVQGVAHVGVSFSETKA